MATVTPRHPPAYAHRPEHRIRAGAHYDRAYRQGARAGDGTFAVNAFANGLGHARLGMSISAKTVGNAVARNRVRRLIREWFRHRRAELPALDVVVTSRPGARDAEKAALLASLDRLLAVAVRKASTDTSRSTTERPTPERGPRR